jgi:hypothetical protein
MVLRYGVLNEDTGAKKTVPPTPNTMPHWNLLRRLCQAKSIFGTLDSTADKLRMLSASTTELQSGQHISAYKQVADKPSPHYGSCFRRQNTLNISFAPEAANRLNYQ